MLFYVKAYGHICEVKALVNLDSNSVEFYSLEEAVQTSMNGVLYGAYGHTIYTVHHIKVLEKP